MKVASSCLLTIISAFTTATTSVNATLCFAGDACEAETNTFTTVDCSGDLNYCYLDWSSYSDSDA